MAAHIEKTNSGDESAGSEALRRYTRRQAVQLQLEMAVRARLQHFDLVSALTLAGAAERVLSDMQPGDANLSGGFNSLKAFLNENVSDPKERGSLAKKARENYDQLRHADTDPDRIHHLDAEFIDALLTIAIEAFAPRPKAINGNDLIAWLHELPPVLGAFWFLAHLIYPMADAAKRKNDPADADALDQIQRWKTSVDPALYDGLVGILQSKSLIPNP
ncbi:MAG: hypothetical protein HXY21_07685 [Parvularculaceae bacterium]|nr:hypothetical protein [Parvularculaceae bacterium]